MQLPKLRLTGGPEGQNMKLSLNGTPLTTATHVVIEAGVSRLATATIELYVDPDVDVTVDEVREA